MLEGIIGLLMGVAVALPFGLMNLLLIRDMTLGRKGRNRFQLVVVNILMGGTYGLLLFVLSRISGLQALGAVFPLGVQIFLTIVQYVRRGRALQSGADEEETGDQ